MEQQIWAFFSFFPVYSDQPMQKVIQKYGHLWLHKLCYLLSPKLPHHMRVCQYWSYSKQLGNGRILLPHWKLLLGITVKNKCAKFRNYWLYTVKALALWKKFDNPADNHTDINSTYTISFASEAIENQSLNVTRIPWCNHVFFIIYWWFCSNCNTIVVCEVSFASAFGTKLVFI